MAETVYCDDYEFITGQAIPTVEKKVVAPAETKKAETKVVADAKDKTTAEVK